MNVYVGAYLEIQESVITHSTNHCVDHDSGSSLYCHICGRHKSEAVTVHRTTRSVDEYWADSRWIDRLQCAGLRRRDIESVEYAISNSLETLDATGMKFEEYRCTLASESKGSTGTHHSRYFSVACEIPDEEACKETFLDAHMTDIMHLNSIGCTVTLKFGILFWD